jgi:zinc/manganese transport system ATP-binding protein
MTPDITLENLTLTYGGHPAVHHLDGSFRPGSMTAIVGPNGAGKSTLLKAIAGLLHPAQGRISGVRAGATDGFAYLPQQTEIDRSFPISVADTVAAGAWARIGAFRGVGAGVQRRIDDALHAVGLDGFQRRPVGSLSAGQFQRVLFARLLLQSAQVILLDEPFTAIDARTTADLMQLVRRWNSESRTVIAVLHDFEQVAEFFPETLLLARELIGWGATADVLTADNLRVMRRMSEQWDEDAPLCTRGAAR